MTDMIKVWLENAEERALPGTTAEKACRIMRELFKSLDEMAGCENCLRCSEYAEDVLERVESIVEEL